MHTYTYQFDTSWVHAPSKSVDFRLYRQDRILQDLNDKYITSMSSQNIKFKSTADKLLNGCIVYQDPCSKLCTFCFICFFFNNELMWKWLKLKCSWFLVWKLNFRRASLQYHAKQNSLIAHKKRELASTYMYAFLFFWFCHFTNCFL